MRSNTCKAFKLCLTYHKQSILAIYDIVTEHVTLPNGSLTEIGKRYFGLPVAVVNISSPLCLGLNSAMLSI